MLQDVYGVPVGARWLVFSPGRKLAALVNARALECLVGGTAGGEGALGGLTAELAQPVVLPEPREGRASPAFLGLTMTRGCGMGCRYCDFAAGRPGAAMSPELVASAVSGYAEWLREEGRQDFDLQFFGGEPFDEPDLIEIAVHRARRLAGEMDLRLRVEACTNGLLGSRMVEFVRDHFDALVLSIDGEAPAHDRHRPLRTGGGSFAEVWRTAQALADSDVALCVRCCVSSANVRQMERTARWLVEALRPETITFEPMKTTPRAAAAGLEPPEAVAFTRGFLAARRVCQAADVSCVHATLYVEARRGFCPAARDAFIVAPDASARACYLRREEWERRGLDLRIGEVVGGRLRTDPAAVERLRAATERRERCIRCFGRWSCAGGCLVTETPPGHDLAYSAACRRTRLLQACVLLEGMGLGAEAEALLTDPGGVTALAEHWDDRLWGGDGDG